jgi:nicotinamidase-related amidase
LDARTTSPWSAVFNEEERHIYELYRRPGRPAFPWDSCALLIVDVTEEFVGPPVPTIEAVRRVRTATGLPAWRAIEAIQKLASAFRYARLPVIYTRSYPGEKFGGAAVGSSDASVVSRIVADIEPAEGDLVIEKPRASAFFETPLVSHLIRAGVRGAVVVGGTTSGCVRASVTDGSSLGFAVVVAHDGCFDRSMLSHWVALQEMDVKYATVLDRIAIEGHLRASTA